MIHLSKKELRKRALKIKLLALDVDGVLTEGNLTYASGGQEVKQFHVHDGIGIMMAMRYGLARGIYANEAGYGTAAVAYATARSRRPVQQGYAAVMEVFVVSFVTSSISALTILVTGVWRSGLTSTAAVAEAFNHAVPGVGGWVVAGCAFLFGFTTLIGWGYYG